MKSSFSDLLIAALDGKWDPDCAQCLFALQHAGCPAVMRTYKAGEAIYHATAKVSSIFILIQGCCHVISTSSDGQYSTIYVNSTPTIFGLTELLNGRAQYTASVIANTSCKMLLLPNNSLLDLVGDDPRALLYLLRSLASSLDYGLHLNARRLLFTRKQQLILYLHEYVSTRSIPCRLTMSRPKLAALLGINLRTLYRYTDELIAQGALSVQNGKLTVHAEHAEMLKSLADQIYAIL